MLGRFARRISQILVLSSASPSFVMTEADWAVVPLIALACAAVEALPVSEDVAALPVLDDNVTVPLTALVLGALLFSHGA